jgi:ribosomal protein S18 acetylase RimI-like enzyme
MPRVTDPSTIRALLETDRSWSIYALGDLPPVRFSRCSWFRAAGGVPALVLLYQAFTPPVLFTLGQPAAVASLLEEIAEERELYLHVRTEVLPAIKACYRVDPEKHMWRMVLDPADYRPVASGDAQRLGLDDLPALRALYADGEPVGESPDFFYPDMVTEGVFYGVREGDELIAAAGTHLVVPEESIGAIGNIYTRRDRRGRGLASRLTSAVAAELLRQGLRTVALNVNQGNAAAIRVYEPLGFRRYCSFCEGVAVR